MNRDEFARWLTHHRAAFTGLGTWLDRLPDQAETLHAWFRVVRWIEFEDAKAASDQMFADGESIPYDRHPATIRAKANDQERQRRSNSRAVYVDGSPTVKCRTCQDQGLVCVVGSRGEAFPGYRYSAAVACNCEKGRRLAAVRSLPIYDPARHERWPEIEEQMEAAR